MKGQGATKIGVGITFGASSGYRVSKYVATTLTYSMCGFESATGFDSSEHEKEFWGRDG